MHSRVNCSVWPMSRRMPISVAAERRAGDIERHKSANLVPVQLFTHEIGGLSVDEGQSDHR